MMPDPRDDSMKKADSSKTAGRMSVKLLLKGYRYQSRYNSNPFAV